MDTITAIRTRRSVRSFQARAVPRELVEALITDANCAPYTPPSRDDPLIFLAVEGVDRIAAIGKEALEYARTHRPQLAGYEWTERPGFSVFHGAPLVLVLSGRTDGVMSAEESIRAGQLLTLAAHARGLGCCWVGAPMLWLRAPVGRAALGIRDGYAAREAFALGFAAEEPPVAVPRAAAIIDWR